MFNIDKSDIPTTFIQYDQVAETAYCNVSNGGINCHSNDWDVNTDSDIYFNKNNFKSTSEEKIFIDLASKKTFDGSEVFSTVSLQGGFQYLLEGSIGFKWNGKFPGGVPLEGTVTAVFQWFFDFGSGFVQDGLQGVSSLEYISAPDLIFNHPEMLLGSSRALTILDVPEKAKYVKAKLKLINSLSTHLDHVEFMLAGSNFLINTTKKTKG